MAARGSIAKDMIYNKLMEIYPNAFVTGKEFRIPIQENGEIVEVKVALTAAKDNLGGAKVNAAQPMTEPSAKASAFGTVVEKKLDEPTEDEKALLRKLTYLF